MSTKDSSPQDRGNQGQSLATPLSNNLTFTVDSSVWIDHLNDTRTRQVTILRQTLGQKSSFLIVGDLVLSEVLQGLSNEQEAALVEAALRKFTLVSMVGVDIAILAAIHFRRLRRRGITIRRTVDLLIGSYCIANAIPLLHSDRDFDHLEQHLGLAVVR